MDNICQKMKDEMDRALALHGDFCSYHEALGIIWEEFDELKREIFERNHNGAKIIDEAIQLGAMCIKLVHFVEQKEMTDVKDIPF